MFECTANFLSSEFQGSADFRSVIFKQDAEFYQAKFNSTSDFRKCSFNQESVFRHTIFKQTSSFRNTEFKMKADFSLTTWEENAGFSSSQFYESCKFNGCEFLNTANFPKSTFRARSTFYNSKFESEVNFNRVKTPLSGHLIFTGVDLSDGNFRRSELSMSDFSRTNLTNSDFWRANLKHANIERAIFSRSDLFGTKLQGAAFYGAVMGDSQINEETEFGDLCVYDPKSNNEPAADLGDDDTNQLTKAAGQYRIIEQLARTNAFPDMVSHNFVRRKDIHREQHRQEGRWGRWLQATASKDVLEYGENPWRLIATGLITVVGFGLLYPLVGGLQPKGGSTITLNRTINNPILLLQSIYYSTLTFTTLGMGDFLPVGLGRLLTTLETSLGAIIIALLVFVFGRRAAR